MKKITITEKDVFVKKEHFNLYSNKDYKVGGERDNAVWNQLLVPVLFILFMMQNHLKETIYVNHN